MLFFDKSAAPSSKDKFPTAVKPFIAWLNTHTIENRYALLKSYETDRMDTLGNHGGNSPLLQLKTLLQYAIESESLRNELNSVVA